MSTSVIDQLATLYAGPVAERFYDEAVTEYQHAMQCAALAAADGAPDELVAAALLHDVGHLLLDDNAALDAELVSDFEHEKAGARCLAQWFGADVTAPVALHVAAKRYLCAVEPTYFATLSPSSVRSLTLQGGPMSTAEVAAFERLPAADGAVMVRRWDEQAKVADLAVADFDHYTPLLVTLGVRHQR